MPPYLGVIGEMSSQYWWYRVGLDCLQPDVALKSGVQEVTALETRAGLVSSALNLIPAELC